MAGNTGWLVAGGAVVVGGAWAVYWFSRLSTTPTTPGSGSSGSSGSTGASTGPGINGSGSSGSSGSGSSGSGSNSGSQTYSIPTSDTPTQRLQAMLSHTSVSLGAGLTPSQMGIIQDTVRRHTSAISGVLPSGAIVLNLAASNAAKVSLLAVPVSIVISGLSSARVAYLQRLARDGQLKGLSSTGTPIF